MSRFFGPSSSTFILALSLTPEMTNALAILIAAIFVGLVNLYMARTARLVAVRETAKALAPLVEKVNTIEPLVTKIDAHVNSAQTRFEGEIATLKMQVEMQRESIADLKLSKELLAQAKAIADAAVVAASVGTQVLGDIETNTKETANNTARTEQKVQELGDKA